MEQRIYHGQITPLDFARSLVAHFNRGNYQVRQFGNEGQLAVQIATTTRPSSGGQTALSVSLQRVEDGVSIQVGDPAWYGVAASLGMSALAAIRNPFTLLGRLDDIAQDIESLQLTEEVWSVVDATARAAGANHELSDRLRRLVCSYCNTANLVGASSCMACGAPLGDVQPITCRSCGFVLQHEEIICPNCSKPVH
jgi:predicted Zn-ribbon and HTH transcriptional regulator